MARGRRPGLLPVAFVSIWLAVMLLAPLALNVRAMQLDWKVAQLEEQTDQLTADRSHLKTQVASLAAAPRIKEEADRLGMALADDVDYLILGGPGNTVLAQANPPTNSGN